MPGIGGLFSADDQAPRVILMRSDSDSELEIFIFRSEKRIGILMQSDVANADGIKSDLRIRWPKSPTT